MQHFFSKMEIYGLSLTSMVVDEFSWIFFGRQNFVCHSQPHETNTSLSRSWLIWPYWYQDGDKEPYVTEVNF